ncbi:hypothetical protein ABZP36_000233 [Zizania latifolia]
MDIFGLCPEVANTHKYMASMGIYVFRTDVLLRLLRGHYPTTNDFGSEVIPMAAKDYNVQAYLFDGYREDIGTIKSFFEILTECSVEHSVIGIRSRLEPGVQLKMFGLAEKEMEYRVDLFNRIL